MSFSLNSFRWNPAWLVGFLILAGFALRLAFIERNIFHADEFISLLAISSILEAGEPRFPSGQLYDKGILFSYLGAGFAALTNFSPIFIRWVSLAFSLLIIPLIYQFGVKIFRSQLAGLFGALVMAFYAEAMLWGGRVRMYSLIQFLYLSGMFLIWLGFVQFKRLYRLIGYGLIFVGLFNHLVLILTLIPFGLALFLSLTPQHQFNWRILSRRSVLAEIIGGILLIATVLLVGQAGFDARLAATTDPALIDEATLDFQTIAASVLDPSEIQGGFASILHYFDQNLMLSLAVLTGIGIIALLSPKSWGPADRAAFMVIVMMALLILEMVLFLDGKWRHGRYYFLVLYPLLLLSASYGLTRLVDFSQAVISRFIPASKLITSLLLLVFVGWLSLIMLSTSYKEMGETFKTYRYDLGWSYVSQHLKPEDTTISAWPAAAYLYNNHHLDYYANQEVPVVMADPTYSYMVDKYAGARFINTIQELNQVLDQPGRTWFVEEDARLFNFFEADFVQQLFHQMTLVKSFDNIHVFVEKEEHWPLAETPLITHSVDLPGQAKFIGYAFQPAKPTKSQPIFLTLFWQPPISPVFSYKIFVHLRNSQGVTVAQADFVPLEGATVDLKGWVRRVGSDEILRTGITLWLPADLPNDSYTLWVGVYEADSLQRLSVANDTSGENAIRLEGSLIELR